MNKQGLKILLIFPVVVLLICGFIIVDTYLRESVPIAENPTPDPLEAELSAMISRYENGETSFIDLSAITSFSWDRLYVFGPYTPLSSLESTVGRSWRNICFTQIDVLEGYDLLVFTKNKRVVRCLEYLADKYEFSLLESYSSGFSIQEARFVLDENKTVIWTGDK